MYAPVGHFFTLSDGTNAFYYVVPPGEQSMSKSSEKRSNSYQWVRLLRSSGADATATATLMRTTTRFTFAMDAVKPCMTFAPAEIIAASIWSVMRCPSGFCGTVSQTLVTS